MTIDDSKLGECPNCGSRTFVIHRENIAIGWDPGRNGRLVGNCYKCGYSQNIKSKPDLAKVAIVPPPATNVELEKAVGGSSQIMCGSCSTMNDLDAVFCKKCRNRFR